MNETLSAVVASASFLLTAIALAISALAIAWSAHSTYLAKRTESETKRLELSYRLLITSAGGGDALLARNTHYSNLQIQIAAIASLRGYPEFHSVYERLAADRRRLAQNPRTGIDIDQNLYDKLLLSELEELVKATSKKRR